MDFQFNRERSMPLFLLASMSLHALLFFFVPKVTSGMFPGRQLEEQGGLTYVTIVDIPVSEQARAPVAAAMRQPQVRPRPRQMPVQEPGGPSTSTTRPDPTPVSRNDVPSVIPTPAAEPVTPSVQPEKQLREPVNPPSETPRPVIVDDQVRPDPVETTSVTTEQTVPDAVTDETPRLPPTGESMVHSFGGSTFPKNAVGLVQGRIEVEVAAIVNKDGDVVDVVVVGESGIAAVDVHAENVVRHLVRFKPHDDLYEMRVFITFDGADQNQLHVRYGEFIITPPSMRTPNTGERE